MNSISIFERIFLFFAGGTFFPALQMLPSLVLQIGIATLAIIGWQKHRAVAFLLFLMGAVLGLGTNIFFMRLMYQPPTEPGGYQRFTAILHAIGYVAMISNLAGLWFFVYRTRLAPGPNAGQ